MKQSLYTFLFVFLFSFTQDAFGQDFTNSSFFSNQNCEVRDSIILVDFYYAFAGWNWDDQTRWKLWEPIDSWHGISSNESGCVTEINLENIQLNGFLPPNIKFLDELVSLDLSNCGLIGPLQEGLSQLINLTYLDLSQNQIEGTIPENFANLSNLSFLDLSNNSLSGNLPNNFANYCDIEVNIQNQAGLNTLAYQYDAICSPMCFKANEIDSTMLLAMQGTKNFGWDGSTRVCTWPGITIDETGRLIKFIGTELPDDFNFKMLGHFEKLTYIDLTGHDFQNYDKSLSLWDNLVNLDTLIMANFNFDGALPTVIPLLPKLEFVDISGSRIFDTLNTAIGHMQHLQYFDGSSCGFTGDIPPSFKNLCDIDVNISNNLKLNYTDDFSLWCNMELPIMHSRFTDSLIILNFYKWFDGDNWQNPWPINEPLENWDGIGMEYDRITSFELINQIHQQRSNSNFPSKLEYLDSLKLFRCELNNLTGVFYLGRLPTNTLETLIFRNQYKTQVGNNPLMPKLHTIIAENVDQVSITCANLPALEYLSTLGSLANYQIADNLPQLKKWKAKRPSQTLAGTNGRIHETLEYIEFERLDDNSSVLNTHRFSFNVDTIIYRQLSNKMQQYPLDPTHNYPNLKYLQINNGEMKAWFSQGIIEDLKHLDLSHNEIDFLNLERFPGLEYLKLENNTISGLPFNPNLAEKLTVLDLDNNSIPSFYSSFNKMRNLIIFSANNNNISGNLPQNIVKMKNLKRLYLANNNLSGELPVFLSELKKLNYIILLNNNFQGCIPKAYNIFCSENVNFDGNNLDVSFEDFCIDPEVEGCGGFAPVLSSRLNENVDIYAYPNPCNNELHISTDLSDVSIHILDLNGVPRVQQTVKTNDVIDMSSLPSAIYILKVYQNEELIGVDKISKQ